ncbi:MAG: MJ1255/VC2487 family glycosyltransferase [Candidatus Woesearchaeota archaeon]
MAKILYGIQAEGMGHTTRSKPIIDELSKDNDIILIGSDNVCNYYQNHKDKIKRLEWVANLKIFYYNNKVSVLGTVIKNLIEVPLHLFSIVKIFILILKERPDMVITDFEYVSCYLGTLLRIPVISVDNEQIISKTRIVFNKKHIIDYLNSRFVLKLELPHADRYLVTSFFFPIVKDRYTEVYGPVLRDEIINLKTKTGDHVLVYQTSKSSKTMADIFHNINENFIVYGFGKDEQDKNITYKKFNEDDFFRDLGNCKAVIMNGGFTLMTEALYLKKPILSIPVKFQFEQILNAEYLANMGYGASSIEFNEHETKEFLSNLGKYRKNMKKNIETGNIRIIKRLKEIIANLKKQGSRKYL